MSCSFRPVLKKPLAAKGRPQCYQYRSVFILEGLFVFVAFPKPQPFLHPFEVVFFLFSKCFDFLLGEPLGQRSEWGVLSFISPPLSLVDDYTLAAKLTVVIMGKGLRLFVVFPGLAKAKLL